VKSVTAKETLTVTTKVVLPNETNNMDNLFGGQLLAWMDINASVSAYRLCHRNVTTAAVNNVSFDRPIPVGAIVTLESKVTRSFKSSMEIFTEVYMENPRGEKGERIKCNESIYTFVALDYDGKPVSVPELVPETEEEKQRYDAALRRRQLSLILAGRIKPNDATELKALFIHED
jgi:acyl-CoA hydrolase